MRLEDLTPDHVRSAVATYMRIAWEGATPRPRFDPAQLDGVETLDELFALCEKPQRHEAASAARYTLRLGNSRYPFMKFVVQEYLVEQEYFFSVDTHDDHLMTPEHPEWDEWCELKQHNRALKSRIEAAWTREELPTYADLRMLAEGIAQHETEGKKLSRLLVVDDEREICASLRALLEARGYGVDVAFNGQQVLDRLADDPLPDLVILDFAMPELDGVEVLRRIRADGRTQALPVLMATASSIDLSQLGRANGLLRKPYPREVLIAMVKRLLEAARD